MNVDPQALQDAAEALGNIETTLSEANAIASIPTGTILSPAADEVSAAITALFNSHAITYQGIAAQAQAFHSQLIQTMTSSAAAYQATENSAANMLRAETTAGENGIGIGHFLSFAGSDDTPAPVPPTDTHPTLVVGGTGYATVPPKLLNQIGAHYYPTGGNMYSLYTPEQFWPLTPQLGPLTLDQSVKLGTLNLDAAIQNQLAMGHSVNVWGTSQGATVESQEIRYLMAHGSPGTDKVSFMLTGDPNNPDGGLMTRFPHLWLPGLGVHFTGPTPPDSPYQTTIYSNQYDGVANFPRYPLNVVSDANALAGFGFGAHDYVDNPYQTVDAHQLPTSPGYTGHTKYYMTLTQDLPLLDPIRYDVAQPWGPAVADLLQPDLRVIVDMGYGSGEYANIPTPASLIEIPNVPNIAHDLVLGTVQGPTQSLVDLGLLPGSYNQTGHYPYSPVVDPGLNLPTPQNANHLF
jgi:hypothetical protein